MKNLMISLTLIVLFSTGFASYTYEVYTFGNSKSLVQEQTVLVDSQGGMPALTLWDDSGATIRATSFLTEGSGGIWEITLLLNSSLYMSGGQVNMINIGNDATAIIRGGRIDHIYSNQWVPTCGRDGEPIPHIKLYYSGDEPEWNPITNILTGTWEDGSSFTIQLHDVPSYSPAISNIDLILIPEPTTILLLGLGGLLIRRKK